MGRAKGGGESTLKPFSSLMMVRYQNNATGSKPSVRKSGGEPSVDEIEADRTPNPKTGEEYAIECKGETSSKWGCDDLKAIGVVWSCL